MRKVVHELKTALQTRTAKNTQITFFGQLLNAALGYFTNIIMLRTMTLEDYGTFSLFFSVLMLISGFINLGWTETFVRFGSEYVDKSEFRAIERYFLNRILFVSLCVSIFISFFASLISRTFYHRSDFTGYFLWAVVGSFLLALITYITAHFQVHLRFKQLVKYQVSTSFLKLLATVIVAVLGFPLLIAYTSIAIAILVVMVFIGFLIIHFDAVRKNAEHPPTTISNDVVQKMKTYNQWIFVSLLTTHIACALDAQFLAHYHNAQTLAAFSAATRLTLPLTFIISAMTKTILPRLSRIKNDDEIRFYISKLKLFLIVLIPVVLLMTWLLPPFLIWLAGNQYSDIAPLIQLQCISMVIACVGNPVGLVLLAWQKTKQIALLNVVQLILTFSLNVVLIPKYGAVGAIFSLLCAHVVGTIYISFAVYRGLQERQRCTGRY